MSVRVITNHEADQLAAAALAVGLITDHQEATEFGRRLIRQHIEAFASNYPTTDEAIIADMRASADAYIFTATRSLDQVYEVMSAYDYNAASEPSWSDDPLRAWLEVLKERWRRCRFPD